MMAKLERSPQQARMEAVSRDALVQAALQEITQNYREASLSNVARAYGVSLAYVSECVRAQTGRTYKELLQKHRMETGAHRHHHPPPHRMKPSFDLLPLTAVLPPRARRSVFAAKWRKIWCFMENCVILK